MKKKWLLLQETNSKMENKMYFLKESYNTLFRAYHSIASQTTKEKRNYYLSRVYT